MTSLLKQLSPYFFAACILIGINLVFFSPELSGKVLQQRDMINNMAMSHEAKTHFEKTGHPTYWTNSMFGGMPTYQFFNPQTKISVFEYITSGFSLFMGGSLGYYLILSLAAFVGLCCLGIGPWLALIGAYSIAFATNHISLVSAGHLTKIASLGFVPMILIGAYLMFNKNWKVGSLVFTFGLAANIRNNHIQMTYYAAMITGIYVLAEFISRFKTHSVKTLIRPGILLMAGMVIAIAVNFYTIMGLRSFVKDTMRGGTILNLASAPQAGVPTASSQNGLGWEYAMQWSEGLSDLLSIIIPGAVGGSSNEVWSKNSRMADAFRQSGIAITDDFKLPMYWGDLPFTNGPDYLGILMVLLFIMGLVLIDGPFKWFALLSVLFMIVLSLGNNFSIFNKPLFDYLPYYNKFRAPNSILNVLSVVVPVFALFALYHFIQRAWTREALLKLFKKTVFPLAAFLTLLIVAGPHLFDMTSELGDPDWKNNKVLYAALLDARGSYFRSDAFRSLIILSLGSGLMYFFALKKLKLNDFLLGLGLLIGFDLWLVAKRYVNIENYQPEKIETTNFKARPVDLEILKDSALSYRVMDLSVNTFNSAIPSYFHKTIGGDCAAKLRRYQDMIDFYFSKNNTTALRMMNTKYQIDKQGVLKTLPNALGNAWFVSRVKTVRTPDEEIEAVKNLIPDEEAIFLQSEFKNIPVTSSYENSGFIRLTDYTPDRLVYQSSATGARLAVFSEVWFGPDKGWMATIDGQPAPYFRVNYILRGMLLPEGEHKVEFKFVPKEIAYQQNISFYAGMLFGILILAALTFGIRIIIHQPVIAVELEPIPDASKTHSISKRKK